MFDIVISLVSGDFVSLDHFRLYLLPSKSNRS